MRLIFLYGLPATGKLTVAQELKAITGFPVFHNHLVVDLLLSAFAFGSAPFVVLREEIWLSFFREACVARLPGLIFTFAPEATVRPSFPQDAVTTVLEAGGSVDFVELTCPVEELKRRLNDPSRRQYQKLTSVEIFDELMAAKSFEALAMPMPALTVDTSLCFPKHAAREIVRALGLS